MAQLETYMLSGSIKVVERFFDLPLNYYEPLGSTIRVFVRHLIPTDMAKTPDDEAKLPYILFLQGASDTSVVTFGYQLLERGPGVEVDLQSHFNIAAATLWMDSRGTGLSTPFTADLVGGKSDQEIFEYLKNFRADSIVRDCERIREAILGHFEDPEKRKWTILGQSFGGFVALTYLSFYPEGLKEVFLTAGLAPLVDHPDPVYHTLEAKVYERNVLYYQKYPGDVKRVRDILRHLDSNQVVLPNGGYLSPTRFLQLGLEFGMHGGIDRVHQLVFRAANDLQLFGKLSYGFLQNLQALQRLDSNPFYAILHEVIYCQGRAANWAGRRVLAQYKEHQWSLMKKEAESKAVYFVGELIFPENLDDCANLRPLKEAAHLLGPRPTLSYVDDMYVEFGRAQATAASVANVRQFISNRYLHNGIRKGPASIIKELLVISKREYD
ncbi:alpha/beta-hydrolase [Gymnopilus junonius]|uniref:Alpha/beta-hydrolase n=1 Tax=Gymnopilus junonius TaxID=109634 RepID=A0A9P5TN83_GYMJU|nr:alpha/beta-hydrolase [Gymnopilus junonius]